MAIFLFCVSWSVMDCSYIKSALQPHDLPDLSFPEVAFVGRSNAGKSSLINGLLQRQKLARHSRTPGRTALIHFFKVGKDVVFVDLPGYGYAESAKGMRDHWPSLVEAYFRRPNVRIIVMLADVRRRLDETDLELLQQMRNSSTATVFFVLTKTDKLKQAETSRAIKERLKEFHDVGIDPPTLYAVSNLKKTGMAELRQAIFATVSPEPPAS